MKRFIAFILLILTVGLSFVSCTTSQPYPQDTSTTTAPTPSEPEKTPLFTETTGITPSYPHQPVDTVPPAPDTKYFAMSNANYIYDDVFIYTEHDENWNKYLKYQRIEDMVEGGHSIYSTTVAPEDDIILNSFSIAYIVDKEATEKNGGSPVLIIALERIGTKSDSSSFRIISFNTATNEMTTIVDEKQADVSMGPLFMYDDTIYYMISTINIENPNKEYGKICSVKKDGSEHKEFPTKYSTFPSILSIYKDKIYYIPDIEKNPYVYASDLNFENAEKLMKVERTPAINDGYIYYSDNKRNVVIEGVTTEITNVYRRRIDNIKSSTKELLVENVFNFRVSGSYIVYNYKEDLVKIDGLFSPYLSPYTLRSYDINTGESSTLITTAPKPESIINIMSSTKSGYIFFSSGDKEFLINIQTKKLYPII